MASNKFCPACAVYNKRNKLKLKQINFRLAVYLCEDNTCTYPAGFNFVEVEQRTLNELLSEKKQQSIKEDDIDAWLIEYLNDEDGKKSPQSSDDINSDLAKIFDEITNLNNENDLDLQYHDDILACIDDTFQQLDKNCKGNSEQLNDLVAINESVDANLDILINQSNEVTSPILPSEKHHGTDRDRENLINFVVTDQSLNNFNNMNLDILMNQSSKETNTFKSVIGTHTLEDISLQSCDKNVSDKGVYENILKSETSANEKDFQSHTALPKCKILNFQQCRVPTGDNSDISCKFKVKYNKHPRLPSNDRRQLFSSEEKMASKQKISVISRQTPSQSFKLPNKFKNFNYTSVVIKSIEM